VEGNWVNGKSIGLDWSNAITDGTKVYGTDCTGGPCGSNQYHDTIAILGDKWRRDQFGQGKVYSTNTSADCNKEVEILLRTTITAHSDLGYEVNANTKRGNPYYSFVKVTGVSGSFTILKQGTLKAAPATGDTFYASITGYPTATITLKVNGTTIDSATDPSAYASGAPGLGFYHENLSSTCNSNEFGYTSYTAGEL
jgi:hypothetical protein